jgi:hypothetical protein
MNSSNNSTCQITTITTTTTTTVTNRGSNANSFRITRKTTAIGTGDDVIMKQLNAPERNAASTIWFWRVECLS